MTVPIAQLGYVNKAGIAMNEFMLLDLALQQAVQLPWVGVGVQISVDC